MKPRLYHVISIIILSLFPNVVFAGACAPGGDVSGNAYTRLMNTIRNAENFVLQEDLVCVLGAIVELLLIAAWIAAIIWIIYSGIQYALSMGEPDKIAQAKQSLIWASIGFVISLSAYIIIKWVEMIFG